MTATVRHETASLTGVGGTTLFTQSWLPDGPPQSVVLLVHGLGEHSSRYEYVATALVADGHAVFTLDHRGHGRSEGQRVQIRHFSDFTDDIDTYAREVRAAHPDVPFFVLGHSMGGLVALGYVTEHPEGVAGLIVSATAATPPSHISGATIAAGRVIARIAPGFGVAALPLDKVSRDPDVVRAYFADPLISSGQKVRARLGAEMLKAMGTIDSALPGLTLPVLILHGGDDAITDVDASRRLDERIGSQDKTLTIYAGLFHEIFNEPERDVVIADVRAGLLEHRA